MENLIPLVLFTYPGAVCEYVYLRLAVGYAFCRKPDEAFRAARIFFLSALVTAVCLLISGAGTLSALMERLQEAGCLFGYLAGSLLTSGAVGVIWFGARLAVFRAANRQRAERHDPTEGEAQTVWEDLFHDPQLRGESYVAAVYRDGTLIRAGIIYEHTRDLREDPGIILMYSRMIEAELRLPAEERTLIGLPYAHYIDVSTGTEVAFYEGDKACAYLQEYQAAATSSEAETAAAPSEAGQAAETMDSSGASPRPAGCQASAGQPA